MYCVNSQKVLGNVYAGFHSGCIQYHWLHSGLSFTHTSSHLYLFPLFCPCLFFCPHSLRASSVVFHTRRMVRDELAKYQEAEDLMQCADLGAVQALVQKLVDFEVSG